jgi:large subunit ribosomal protein L28
MANTCAYCGKTYDVGHNVSHAKNRTQRMRRANLRERRVVEAGGIVRRSLCTKCARTAMRPQDLKTEVAAAK